MNPQKKSNEIDKTSCLQVRTTNLMEHLYFFVFFFVTEFAIINFLRYDTVIIPQLLRARVCFPWGALTCFILITRNVTTTYFPYSC